jgi:hypothetical protein
VSGPAAPSVATARADRGAAPLGEPFQVDVVLRHAAEDRWTVADGQDLGPFALRSSGCESDRAGGGEAYTRCSLTLDRVDLGDDAPALALAGAGPGGEGSFTVRLPDVRAVLVTDPSRPARDLPLAGVAPPAPLLVPTWRPLGVGGGGLVAAAALAVVARRALARRRRPRPAPSVAPSPAAALLAEVEAAAAAALPGRELLYRLAAAARRYVEATGDAPATALTGRELLARLERSPPAATDRARLAALLALAERICFAREEPSPEQRERAVALARGVAR